MICVNSVKVTPESVTLKAGQWYYNARAEVCPLDAECRSVRWYSNNTSVATVNAATGYIYAVKDGSAKIYAEATDGSGEKDYITVNVTSGPIYVDSVTLSRTSISLEEGENYTLYANVFPSNADNRTIAWSSSNENIAEVSNGTITAKTAGTAYIYARATDGSEKYAQCQVTVTEEVLVTSVSVSPARKTMTVGDTAYLHETVCPPDADNKEVVWSSSDLSVVTVNYSNGFIMAVKEGVANVYATAADGSGRSGVCEITVYPTVRVQSVEISTEIPETMHVGDVMTLQATVCPMNATNQIITWSSSNENVAEVGMYTGELVIKTAGTVTITATSADGQHTDSRTITAWIDTVIIRKDEEGVTRVAFQLSDKEWWCVYNDLVFETENWTNDIIVKRANHNFFHAFDVNNPEIYRVISNVKTYTDDELKLLYAIDPHGVATYVENYARMAFDYNLENILAYKDHIFSLIYGRPPRYFTRDSNGNWHGTDDKSNLYAVISESESLFGGHPLFDLKTKAEVEKLIIDKITARIFRVSISSVLEIAEGVINIAKVALKVLSTEEEQKVLAEFMEYAVESALWAALDLIDIFWAGNMIKLLRDLGGILTAMAENIPDFNHDMLKFCAYKSKYLIYFETENLQRYKVGDICLAIDNYNSYN